MAMSDRNAARERDLERALREIVGERFTTSPFERWCYTADFVPIPRIVKALFKTLPDAVVKPVASEQVAGVLQYCSANTIPVTPRGGGTSGLFGSVPKKGGLLLDLRGLSRVIDIDRTKETVTAEPGITWWELDRVLGGEELALKSYPSSALSATLAGWIMGSGLGIGSLRYGEVFEQVIDAEIVLPDGTIGRYSRGGDLECFSGSEGMLGVLTRLTLSIRRAPLNRSHKLIYFSRLQRLCEFIRDLSKGFSAPYAIELFDHEYLSLVRASGYPTTEFSPGSATALITFEGPAEEVREGEALVEKLTAAHMGDARSGAEDEWNHRFNMLRIRRAVPTVIPSSLHVPVDKLEHFYAGMRKLDKRPLGFVGHMVSRDDCMVMPMLATDQRNSREFILALHTVRDLAELALSMGGKPGGGVGVWNAPYRKQILSKQKIRELGQKKKDLDPKGILNPGMWPDPLPLFSPALYQPAMAIAGLLDRVFPAGIIKEDKKSPSYEFSACVQCGYCVDYCPTRGEWISASPRGRILTTKEALRRGDLDDLRITPEYVNSIFQCSLCGRRKVDCSVSVNSPEMWVELRCLLAERGMEPESVKAMVRVVADSHNLTGKANEQRASWAKRVKVHAHLERKVGANVVYFVGCVTSFYPMVQDIARSFAQLLDLARVDFTLLGGEEWCCGYPLVSAGHRDEAIESLLHSRKVIGAMGTKTVVVTCPGCYRMWKHEYERATGEQPPFEVLHSTQLIKRLIEDGRIKLGEVRESVTYHDPCDLGRVAGLFDPPRDIIKSVPGLAFTELRDNRERCNCCGSGGDLLASNTDMSLAIGVRKLEEALLTGAKSLVTACPSCIRTLVMAKMGQKSPIEVLDLAQFVWRAAAKK
jgi:Fe-S oxidoreductase/FAD/FMN-containing dehydrogenase